VLLHLAQAEHRVVVTLDTDFGELAFRFGLPADSGVILIRLEWRDPRTDHALALAALTSRDDWSATFAVIERDRVRIRPLAPADDHSEP
jgi:predicted nuclease of predicted toxin-antitoxin system